MKVKTYGVPGLTEWHGKIRAGSIEVAVSFTGGTASPSGAQPAYYMTKDPIVQFVIENSKEFKSGFIIVVMSQDIAGEHPRMAIPKNARGNAGESNATKTETAEKALSLSFSYNDEAKDYLVENFGAERAKIMTRSQIEDFAKGKGIEITWKEK